MRTVALQGLWLSLLAAMIFTLSGCGGSSGATVSGNVTVDGQPLELGLITFTPTARTGQPAGGSIVNGSYKVTNVTPGETVVTVTEQKSTVAPELSPEEREKRTREKMKKMTAEHSSSSDRDVMKMMATKGGAKDSKSGHKTRSSGPSDTLASDSPGNGETHEISSGSQTLNLELSRVR